MFNLIDIFPIKYHIKEIIKLQGFKTDKDILAYSIEELVKCK